MKKITILKAKNVVPMHLTESEREIKYERLKEHSVIDPYHYDEFLKMSAHNTLFDDTDILTLLLKKVLMFCDPIVYVNTATDSATAHIGGRSRSRAKTSTNTSTNAISKSTSILERKNKINTSTNALTDTLTDASPYYINTQLNHYCDTFMLNTDTVISYMPYITYATNTHMRVIGIVMLLPTIRYNNRTVKYCIDRYSSTDFIRNGLWNLYGKSDRYTRQESVFPNIMHREYIIFKDETHALAELTRIFHIIRIIDGIYNSSIHSTSIMALSFNQNQSNRDKLIQNAMIRKSLPVLKTAVKSTYQLFIKSKYDVSLNSDIIKLINGNIEGNINNFKSTTQLQLLLDLYTFDVLPLYYNIISNGIKSKYTKENINKLKHSTDMIKASRIHAIEQVAERLRFRKLKALSNKRYLKEYHLLNDNERATINSMYNRQQLLIKNITTYPMAEVAKLWTLDRIEQLKTYHMLLKFDKQLNSNIKLTDVICPHMMAMLSALDEHAKHTHNHTHNRTTNKQTNHIASVNNINDTDDGDNKIQHMLIKEYSAYTPLRGYYYCKLCGEQIAPIEEESFADINQYSVSNSSSDTDKLIWNQTVFIVNAFVSTRLGLSVKKLIKLITATITPYIINLGVKLSKIRTNTEAIKSDSLKVYTAMYVFSMIIYLITQNAGLIFKTKQITGRGDTENIDIDDSDGATTDVIDMTDIDDSDGATTDVIDMTDIDDSDGATTGVIDAINITHHGGASSNNKHKDNNKEKGNKKNANTTLQDTLKTAINLLVKAYNYEINVMKLSVDDIKQRLLSIFSIIRTQNVRIDTDTSNDTLSMYLADDPIYKLIATVESIHTNREVLLTDINKILHIPNLPEFINNTINSNKLISSELYKNVVVPQFKSNGSTTEIDTFTYTYISQLVEYASTIWNEIVYPVSPIAEVYYKKLADTHDAETAIYHKRLIQRVATTACVKMLKSRTFKPIPVDISLIYDSNGNKLVWNTYIMLNQKTKKRYEMTLKEINASIGTPEYYNSIIVDYKSNTGTIQSKTNVKIVLEQLTLNASLESFYNYYAFKCPVRGLHEYDSADVKCVKCYVSRSDFKNHSTTYYKKYVSTYHKQRAESRTLKLATYKWKHQFHAISGSFKLNTSSIGNISKRYGIEYNMLLNLGLSEEHVYDRIKTKQENPSEHVNVISTNRSIRLMDYYRTFMIYRNYLTHGDKLTYIPIAIKKLIDKHTNVLSNLKLPEVKPLDVASMYKLNPSQLSYYILQKLFDDIAVLGDIERISSVAPQPVNDVVRILLQKIIQDDTYFSKYDYNRFREKTISQDDATAVEDDNAEVDNDNNADNIGIDADDYDEGAEDQFGYEGFDLDESDIINIEPD